MKVAKSQIAYYVDDEQGTFHKIETSFKDTVFSVLFVLLKGQEISIYTAFIFAIVQFFQLIWLVFHPTINPVWGDSDIVKIIQEILSYFTFVKYLGYTNYTVYIAIMYGVIVYGLVSIGIIFYIQYSFSRKTPTFKWPISFLRNTLLWFTNPFFLPTLDYFLSVVTCVRDNQDRLVHYIFTEVQCWNGYTFIYMTFAIFFGIIYLLICFVTTLVFFEYQSNTNDATARVSSRANLYVLIYMTIMMHCHTIFTDYHFQVILLLLILGGSSLIFYKFYFNSPYHDEHLAKLWRVLASLVLWSAVMLIFAKILQGDIFEGNVIVWLVGNFFIIYLLMVIPDSRNNLLLINVNKFHDGDEVQNQIRYILKLIQWQADNRNAAILLDGYIETHKHNWRKEEDVNKQKGVKNNRFTKSLMSQDDTLNEKYAQLIQMLYKMYFFGIKKFPRDISLRIGYAFFLLEKMQSKQQALQELSEAEENNPTFDYQFIIFRYKKLIEDDIAESQNEGKRGLDVVSEIAFQNSYKQLQVLIERSAYLHREFWSQLSEDKPDLSKLNGIGSQINMAEKHVEESWDKLVKINPNNPKSMRLYGKYLIEILNYKDEGDQLLEKALHITNVQNEKKFTNLGIGVGEEFTNDTTPVISISGDQDNFGIITHINLMAASLFGYNKTELLNRKVNVLMPQVFSKYHDLFLENFLNSGESAIIGKNKLRLVFGKNKSNYILPLYLNIKAVQSIIQGIQFIAAFRVEKNFKNAAYILTNPDGTIDAMSSSCITLLKLDLKTITHKKANIQDFMPDLINNRSSIFSSAANTGRSSATINYTYPLNSEYFYDENEGTSIQLACQLSELSFLSGREYGGLQFKFEKVTEKNVVRQADRKAKLSNFQFRIEINRGKTKVLGEYIEGKIVEVRDVTQEGSRPKVESVCDVKSLKESLRKKSKQEDEAVEVKKKDYGAGIKTYKLLNGKPLEIEVDSSFENEEDDEENHHDGKYGNKMHPLQKQQTLSMVEENPDDDSLGEFDATFKSRKTLNAVINDKRSPTTIRNLKITINLLCLLLSAIAIVEYTMSISTFNSIQQNITAFQESNQCLSELMRVLSRTQDLYLLNIGLTTGLATEANLRNDLKIALDNTKSLMLTLQQQTSWVFTEHLNLFNNAVIGLYSIDGSVTYEGLFQATQEIISKGYVILNKALSHINDSDEDCYYVIYNLLNNLYSGMQQSSELYVEELLYQVDNKYRDFLPYLLTSIGLLILALIALLPVLYQVSKSREEVLSLFLDIPEKSVKALYVRCETFISNLYAGEGDDVVADTEEEVIEGIKEEDNMQEFILRRKKKRFKNSSRNYSSFLLRFFAVTVIVEAYFLSDFLILNGVFEEIKTIIIEYNSTSASAPFYSFANNVERQLFIDPSINVLQFDSETVAIRNIQVMYNLNSLVLQQHAFNRDIFSDTYNDLFNQIMMLNPCSNLGSYVSIADCTVFQEGTVSQGMAVGLTTHFEDLRVLLNCYSNIEHGSSCSVPLPSVSISGKTAEENERLSLIITSQGKDAYAMQQLYINETFSLLISGFEDNLKDNFETTQQRKLTIFIVFQVAIIVLYLITWIPIIMKTTNDILKTKSMLGMIPLDVIAKVRSIRMYLKRYWVDRSLAK